jgi:hypothetical protein
VCGGDGVLEKQHSAVRSGWGEAGDARRSATRRRAGRPTSHPAGDTTGKPAGGAAPEGTGRSACADRVEFSSQDAGDCRDDERNADVGCGHTT